MGNPLYAEGQTDAPTYHYNMFGAPGLIDMPTARSGDDAELAATLSHFAGTTRTTLSFQITPRLSGSFRYTNIENAPDVGGDGLFDRSFDLRYRLVDEGHVRPSVAVGLRDFIGTGVYSSEYIVATKQVTPTVEVSGGIGWGLLGSYNGFTNPLGAINDRFETRPTGFSGTGGQVESARWFRGDAALFGGLRWQTTDSLSLIAEYSSDDYAPERNAQRDLFDRASALNFGLSYAFNETTAVQAHYLYGSELAVGLTFGLNPKRPLVNGSTGQRPTPVVTRPPEETRSLAWTQQPDGLDILRSNVDRLLAFEGMTLEAMTVAPTLATVQIRNNTYIAGAEAVGRTARILTKVMPASVETFVIVPVVRGIRTSAVHITRTDVEVLEFEPDNAWKSYARAKITDAAGIGRGTVQNEALYPQFRWRFGPYITTSYFDPDSPIRADIGLELSGRYVIGPGLTLAGKLRQPLVGTIGDGQGSDSVIEPVRTNGALYAQEGQPALTQLTGAYHFNLAPDYYGRVSAGYLEPMFGGLSAEVLWKPVDSRLGVGLELNYVKQRDFDQLFGFQDYDVVTGHASAYYTFENNLHAQIDVGRYLAGDYGATLALDREFDNGWRVGAFATFTDVSFDDFGEGSFDKGIRFSIPMEHFLGTPSRRVEQVVLRPLTRDGGARLNVDGRLYETVRSYHDNDLRGSWGRFWR
ncbi:YjbH domain-containing protein [Yoonia sp. GPGPB17]|uniref:YjbH domain-containing protein n=1 Tax=Yoonia sp. GPGPB17 TaxID=3026147 RepID=UPI0030BB64F6